MACVNSAHNFEAVIFDNDGTLVDSESITLGVLMEMAVEHGADVSSDDPERFVGAHLQVVFEEIATRSGKPIPDDFIDVFRDRQTQRIKEGLDEIPGARDLLEYLSNNSVRFAVASNAPQAKMELCLNAAGLDSFFPAQHRTSAYDIDSWKPLPDIFVHAANALGVDITQCAIVEDSNTGIEAALASGATTFAVDPAGRFEAHPKVVSLPGLSSLKDYL